MDISGLLARKYDILQQNSDSQQRLSQAQSGLIGAQTTAEPLEAAARAAAARGTAAAGFGQAALANANASTIPSIAQSEIGLRSAQGNELGTESWLNQIRGLGSPNLTAGYNKRYFGDTGGDDTDTGAPQTAPVVQGGSFQGRSVLDTGSSFRPVGLSNTTNTIGGDPTRTPGYASGTSDVGPSEWEQSMQVHSEPHGLGSTSFYAPARDRSTNARDPGIDRAFGIANPGYDAANYPVPQQENYPARGGQGGNSGGGKPRGYDTGTSQVPGKGSPKVDSVKAKLAPGEAVLNAAAADHLGRSTIDFLNAIGAAKMGLNVPDTSDKSTPAKGSKDDSGQKVSNQTGDPPGYARGTSKVAQKGPSQKSEGTKRKPGGSPSGAPGPTLPPPGVMQALMSMSGVGNGGGGMPGPGGPSPLPMQLPQVAR